MKQKKYNISLDNISQVTTHVTTMINQGHNIITLSGDLGAGKTTFVKHLLEHFNIPQTDVTSPTFNLLNIYNTPSKEQIWHYDLYRLQSSEEIINLDFEDALTQKLTIIEWPEIITNYLPKHKININIETISKNNRNYIIS